MAEVLNVSKYTEDLNKGKYIGWLQNMRGEFETAQQTPGQLGYLVAEKINAPKQAFDAITKFKKDLEALNVEFPPPLPNDLSNDSKEEQNKKCK